MQRRPATLVLACLACSACFAWSPGAGGPLPPSKSVPSAVVTIDAKVPGWDSNVKDLLMRSLREEGRFEPEPIGSSPQGLRVLFVKVRDRPHGQLRQVWAEGSIYLAGLLPAPLAYGFDLEFSIGQGLQTRVYRYQIVNRGLIWLPLLPFAWISLLTPDEEDAFRGVVRRFIADAAADGAW